MAASAGEISGCFSPGTKKIHSQSVGIAVCFCRISKLLNIFFPRLSPNVIESYNSFFLPYLKSYFCKIFLVCTPYTKRLGS